MIVSLWVNSEDKNQQMTLILYRFPDKYLWLQYNFHTVDHEKNLNSVTEIPIEMFYVRRLDWNKCYPV